MTRSRGRRAPRPLPIASAVLLLAVLWTAGTVRAQTQDADVCEFERRLQTYLDLRAALARQLGPLTPTANPVELAARQAALASALTAARATARPGDLGPPPVAVLIQGEVRADFERRAAAAERAVFDDVPNAPRPAVNRPYPADAALSTVPPLLLAKLPRLPDNLQYRFYGRDVVILDGDVQLIVDVIPDALPPH